MYRTPCTNCSIWFLAANLNTPRTRLSFVMGVLYAAKCPVVPTRLPLRTFSIDKCTVILYDKSMCCALYCRVSTTDQHRDLQLRELRQDVAARDWKIAGEYIDTGFSGAKASRPALDRLMADAGKRKFDCVAVWKLDRFGRSVPNLSQQLAALTSFGVRFVLRRKVSTPTSRIRPLRFCFTSCLRSPNSSSSMIRERTLSGIKAAQAAGKIVGRPKRVFRRDEVVRLRELEGLSWRAIGKKLGIPAMTALDSYRQSPPCTETVLPETPESSGKRKRKTLAA